MNTASLGKIIAVVAVVGGLLFLVAGICLTAIKEKSSPISGNINGAPNATSSRQSEEGFAPTSRPVALPSATPAKTPRQSTTNDIAEENKARDRYAFNRGFMKVAINLFYKVENGKKIHYRINKVGGEFRPVALE